MGDSRVHPAHEAWDQIVLLVDDPWWNTHYPPNGWGCRCHVRSANKRQLEKEELNVGKAPEIEMTNQLDRSTGELVPTPNGIDLGWDYNIGKAYLGPDAAFGRRVMQLPAKTRDAALASTTTVTPYLLSPFRRWAKQALASNIARGETRTVGWLSPKTVNFLDRRPGAPTPETALITITDARLKRMQRELKRRLAKKLADTDLFNMPQHIANRKAVLYDIRGPALLYVFDVRKSGKGKFVVRINFRHKGEISNSVRSGDITPAINLMDKSQFVLVEGKL